MEQNLLNFLHKAGWRIFAQKLGFLLLVSLLAVSLWFLGYGVAVLTIKSMSLTWGGLLTVPALVGLFLLIAVPVTFFRLRNLRSVAQTVESRNPKIQLALRSCLDFIEGRMDQDTPLKEVYLEQISEQLDGLNLREDRRYAWGRYASLACVMCLGVWGFFGNQISAKFYNPSMSFGQTHLDLQEGSITIFEPDYTQIPGRTLPLKAGSFSAYPGAKVRFLVRLPEGVNALYLAPEGETEQDPVPLRISEERTVAHEMVLLESTSLRFLLAEEEASGRTPPFKFSLKTDEPPEVQLRSYTPEGPINVMDPLIVELEVKDDFGNQSLEAVVTWDGGEKRLPLKVPAARRNHFLTKRQWYLSDFEMGDADNFSIYFEAKDNNPIDGPGIGKSSVLTYELESPDKKYDEFMDEAKQLLDTMANVLGDNLETELADSKNRVGMEQAEVMGKRISQGLYQSLTLTNNLISKVRETPNLTRLDQNFLHQFRSGISHSARSRSEMAMYYKNHRQGWMNFSFRDLKRKHQGEELKVEGLTYDLLMQLKMWATFELERQNNELQKDLENLEELLEQAENMDEQELMEMFNKLMDEVMKDFEKMMANAAEEMDMTMQEFMNTEAMQDQQDQMQDLREQIMEALRQGDMEKARALMEELKAQMEAAYQSMQQSMGEMSPEMQQMMQDMKELMGLLRELKREEENLESSTRNLKSELDKEMGGNNMQLGEKQKQEYVKHTEKIHEMLEELYNKLVEYKVEDLNEEIISSIAKYRRELDKPGLSREEQKRLMQLIADEERSLDYLTRDGLDKLQEMTLKNLDQTEKLQEYLDQGELTLSLESGLKLDSSLITGERVAERTASKQLRDEANPKQVFRDARGELQKIIDALRKVKQEMEQARSQHMREQGEKRQQQLAEKQSELQRMIQEFMERTEESFGESQVEDKLNDISRSMEGAKKQLRNSRLESGLRHEQEALQKIGEMMEQLQQSSRPNGRPNQMRFGRRQGQQGDPSLEDIYIPESEKKAARDQMKDAIRERLEKNLPDAYGKEIRKYYEKLMDQ